MILQPSPGESILDPCCGSGGMLLAALEAVRKEHGPEAGLEVHGVDIDAAAVRLAKLNLTLAGFSPNPRRLWPREELGTAPVAVQDAVAKYDEEQLNLFDG